MLGKAMPCKDALIRFYYLFTYLFSVLYWAN